MKKQKYIALLFAFVAMFIYIFPYIVLKQNSIVSPFDNLDSYLPWYKVLSEHGWWQPLNAVIPNYLNGITRNCFHSEFIFQVAIFNFLSPFKAYVVIDVLSRFFGLLGMFLLVKDYIFKSEEKYILSILIATCFAFIPNIHGMMFLTVLGQPLLLWAFLNIRERKYNFYNWLILLFMPCCVNFELVTPFFVALVFAIWIYDIIFKKDYNLVFLCSIFLYIFISIITVYRFVYLMLFMDFNSHRLEFNMYELNRDDMLSLSASIWNGIYWCILKDGAVWNYLNTSTLILPLSCFATIVSFCKNYQRRYFCLLWMSLFFIAMLFGILMHWEPALKFCADNFIFKQFLIVRFYFLLPLIWYILFAFSVNVIDVFFEKYRKSIISIIFILQFLIIFNAPYFMFPNNFKAVFTKDFNGTKYCDYFDEKLFNDIKNYIGIPQDRYRVAVCGSIYGVAAYNGFYVLNDYFNIYPLEYKKIFEKVLSIDDSSKKNNRYFSYWGHKLYLIPDEHIINIGLLKELGCKYIISTQKINQLKENSKIEFLKSFPYRGTANKILYLYKLN